MKNFMPENLRKIFYELLLEFSPESERFNQSDMIIYGDGSDLESIILINVILSLEEEILNQSGLKMDLVELLAHEPGPVGAEQFFVRIANSLNQSLTQQ